MLKPKSLRVDQCLVERRLVETREQAQRLIMAGKVLVDGQPARKPGGKINPAGVISLLEKEPYVSRGGLKLQKALRYFNLSVCDKVCLDVGASTGGFTDCLLQNGARQVFALDVGQGLLHWSLRQDRRVILLEKINARYLKPIDLAAVPDFASVDVSFISLTKVLPALSDVICRGGRVVTLIKPQFEAGRDEIKRGGVVKDRKIHLKVILKIYQFCKGELGWKWHGICTSPITGPAGNVEFLALWEKI